MRQCVQRLQRELRDLRTTPHELYDIAPDPDDLLKWYFVINGPQDTVYAGGRYFGKITIPPNYPFGPPDIAMYTPNGRFCVAQKICLSNTSYHKETWSPLWSIRTMMTALIAFWVTDEMTTGGMRASDAERKELARRSREYNVNVMGQKYKKVLPGSFDADARSLSVKVETAKPEPSVQQEKGSADGKDESIDKAVGDDAGACDAQAEATVARQEPLLLSWRWSSYMFHLLFVSLLVCLALWQVYGAARY